MKVTIIFTGKTEEKYLLEGIAIYEKRIKHYLPFEVVTVPSVKNLGKSGEAQVQEKEGEHILKRISNRDYLVLLDERGKLLDSLQLADFVEKRKQQARDVVLVIGGPYGFSQAVYDRADYQLSLSKMTFSHQMVRLFLVEQVYRALTILRGEPYHHR